jgi:hypothetical protein
MRRPSQLVGVPHLLSRRQPQDRVKAGGGCNPAGIAANEAKLPELLACPTAAFFRSIIVRLVLLPRVRV